LVYSAVRGLGGGLFGGWSVMPVSWPGQIGTVVDAVVRRSPASVLDIGVGWGVYGAVLRAALPAARIDGVESWAAYRWDRRCGGRWDRWGAYDHVFPFAWPPASAGVGAYDVALMVDVIEHMGFREGRDAIDAAMSSARALVIATPHDPMRWPQDDHPNPRERHVGRWGAADIVFATRAAYTVAEAHHLAESIVMVIEP
jgi:hypothetical protein